jgi:hypoxanthine phosphoribosyltransferase
MSFPIVPLKKVKKKLVFTAEEIEKKISTMSRKINDHYDNLMFDKPVLVIGILKSSVFFLTSLLKKLKFPLVVDFLQIDSYYGNFLKKKNMPVISSQTTFCPENHHVLIVEDVIESGKTLLHVKEFLNKKGVLSLNFAILIKKHVSRHVSVDLNDDFLG